MYNKLFNKELQTQMEHYFVHELSTLGRIKAFEKNQIINPENADNIYIVLDGNLNQVLYSQNGEEIALYRLERGNIFGEMDFFDGYRTCVVIKTLSACAISVVARDIVEKELAKNIDVYRHFFHSIIRKYRIVMLEFADVTFNDSLGKIAHTLLRLSYTTSKEEVEDINERTINMTFTHEELANRLASNRTTITNGLKYFKDKGYIKVENKQITILNIEGLRDYINVYIPEYL